MTNPTAKTERTAPKRLARQIGGGVEMRYSVGAAAVLAAVMTLGALAAAIIAGGVGKNGSTVAVSTRCSRHAWGAEEAAPF